jgi:endonuclease-3 related protein
MRRAAPTATASSWRLAAITRNEEQETRNQPIHAYYSALKRRYGPQHWWPGRTRLEVIIGAFLTQNTSWKNVERAISNLRRAHALNLAALRSLPEAELAELIRSSGYFRQKARRIKNFISYLDSQHSGRIARLFRSRSADEINYLRQQLLALNGIGPETADAILLYAGNYPVFVVDAYAKRLFTRHQVLPEAASYDEIRLAVEATLPSERRTQHLNEFHALIVQVGKNHCHKSHPDCTSCPLRRFLPARTAEIVDSNRPLKAGSSTASAY